MTLLSAPAQAGTWKFSCTDASTDADGSTSKYSNSDSFMGNPQSYSGTTPWTPPADATGISYQIPSFGFDPTDGTATADTIRSESVSITAKITMTWMPDTSQPSDPAPTSLWLIESSSAQWVAQYHDSIPGAVTTTGSGSANDGLANPTDPIMVTTANGTKSGEVSSSSNAPVQTSPPAHWFQQPVSGGVVTLTRTFHADASASLPQDDRSGSMTMSCSFGGYTVKIHAQPYGWYDAGYNPSLTASSPDTTPGGYADYSNYQLVFRYKWRSTDGNLAHLSGIDIYEHVDYTGNPGTFGTDSSGPYYRPTSPPIAPDPNVGDGKQAYELGNPEVSHAMTTTGATIDVHSVWPTQKSYSVLTVTAPQKYEFDDPATGEKGTVLYDAGNIQEGVSLNPNIFYIKKSGAHVEKPLP